MSDPSEPPSVPSSFTLAELKTFKVAVLRLIAAKVGINVALKKPELFILLKPYCDDYNADESDDDSPGVPSGPAVVAPSPSLANLSADDQIRLMQLQADIASKAADREADLASKAAEKAAIARREAFDFELRKADLASKAADREADLTSKAV